MLVDKSTLPVWLLPVITLIIGIIIGYIVARLRIGSANQAQRQLETLQERFDNYQEEVVEQFHNASTMVGKLAQHYQMVQQHLDKTTQRLALDNNLRSSINAEAVDVESPPELLSSPDSSTTDSQPPRDYAPKTDGEVGTLDESFGLKK